MNLRNFSITLWILTTVFVLSCSEKEENFDGNGITQSSWSNGEVFTLSAGETHVVTFTASDSWTATTTSSALTALSVQSGIKGENRISITAQNSSTQEATITIRVNGYSLSSRFVIKLGTAATTSSDTGINKLMDEYLKEYYLWNKDYQLTTRDFSQAYDDFLENTLMSMTTNTLDKKAYIDGNGNTFYSLFSYIEKIDQSLKTSQIRSGIAKKKSYSYGFAKLLPVVSGSSNDVSFYVQAVYPESSASTAGLKRSMAITHVGGVKISRSNWSTYYYDLILPTSASTSQLTNSEGTIYTVSSAPTYTNPVILSKVIETDGKKIGYLVYSEFDAGFDQELFNAFKSFKDAEITDLILDLRYNSGGHVMSANLISTCIAGNAAKDKIFAQYRYNDDRMKALGGNYEADYFDYNGYSNLGGSLSAGFLNLTKIYCLTGGSTASSSELVINALRGIDVEVVLIGQTTLGKNVGMEGVDLPKQNPTHELYPITFQSYNAKKFGDFDNGFSPQYKVDEFDQNGDGYFDNLFDFCTDEEPLYAKAKSLITGKSVKTSASTTRSSASGHEKALSQPILKRIGMIK